jgi:hypothetical protein
VASREIDLHGLTWTEALPTFIEFYNDEVRKMGRGGGSLDIVHGYGSTGPSGVLRTRLRAYFQRHEEHLEFMPGESVDGNQGHTVVIPMLSLPSTGDALEDLVWKYCELAKGRSKIIGKFRRHGEPTVIQAIKALESQKRLRVVRKGRVKSYEAM